MQFSVLWGAVDGAVILAAATEEVGGGVEWAGGVGDKSNSFGTGVL